MVASEIVSSCWMFCDLCGIVLRICFVQVLRLALPDFTWPFYRPLSQVKGQSVFALGH